VSLKAELLAIQFQSMNITLSSIYEKYALEWAIDHAECASFKYYMQMGFLIEHSISTWLCKFCLHSVKDLGVIYQRMQN